MRVVIAEDLALLREGLVRLLEDAGLEVVAAVGDGSELLRVAVTERPDVAVVDVRLPPSYRDEGLRAAIEARRRVPELAVLVLSQTSSRPTRPSCSLTAAARSVTCSRSASPTRGTSSRRCGGSLPAGRRSTRRSCGSSWRGAGRWRSSPSGSARCSS